MIPLDKLLHFLVGFCIASILAFSPIAAIVCVVMAGAAKEAYDYISNKYLKGSHEVSIFDFLATSIGGVCGLGIPYAAEYFFTHLPKLLGV